MNDGNQNDATIERILSEVAWLPREEADSDLAALRMAILLEDSLDITLTDAEIDAVHLSTPEGIRLLLHSRPSS